MGCNHPTWLSNTAVKLSTICPVSVGGPRFHEHQALWSRLCVCFAAMTPAELQCTVRRLIYFNAPKATSCPILSMEQQNTPKVLVCVLTQKMNTKCIYGKPTPVRISSFAKGSSFGLSPRYGFHQVCFWVH